MLKFLDNKHEIDKRTTKNYDKILVCEYYIRDINKYC